MSQQQKPKLISTYMEQTGKGLQIPCSDQISRHYASSCCTFHQNKVLKGQHFSFNVEVEVAVHNGIKSKPKIFFMDRMNGD